MIQELDRWAHVNRWHDRGMENGFLAGGLLALAMILPPFPGALLVFGVSMIAATLGAGVPLKMMVRTMAVPCLFLVFGTLPMLVSVQYSADAGLMMAFSPAGAAAASDTALRALGATSALLLLGVTTPAYVLIEALRRLRVPSTFLDLMSLTYRFLFLLDTILMQMITAQNGRLGYGNLRTGFRSGALVIANLFTRTLARAQSMEQGLAARGYDGDLPVVDSYRRPNAWNLAVIAFTHGVIALCCLVWRSISSG